MSSETRKASQRKFYANNREQVIAEVMQRQSRIRDYVRSAKDRPCADCGECYPFYVMQFDHVRGTKEFNLARASQHGYGQVRVRDEIAKCDVVCANCHAIRTYERSHEGVVLVD